MPIPTPTFDTGRTYAFDGAVGVKASTISGVTVDGRAGGNFSQAVTDSVILDGNGKLVTTNAFDSVAVAFDDSQGAAATMRWTWEPQGNTNQGIYNNLHASIWDDQIRFLYQPVNNRLIVRLRQTDGQYSFNFCQLPAGTFVWDGANNVFTTIPSTMLLEVRVVGDQIRPSFNGVALDVFSLTGWSGTRAGKNGLSAAPPEGGTANPRVLALDFGALGKTNTLDALPRFIPEGRSGANVVTKTYQVSGGANGLGSAPQSVIYRVRSKKAGEAGKAWENAGSPAFNAGTFTATIPLDPNTAWDDKWLIDVGVIYADGKASSFTREVAVGGFGMLFGQSWAIGGMTPRAPQTAVEGAYAFSRGNPTGWSWRGGAGETQQLACAQAYAEVMSKALNKPYGIACSGQSAVGIEGLLPGAIGWTGDGPELPPDDDNAALLEVMPFTGGMFSQLVFWQSIGDANDDMSAGAWANKFTNTMVPALRDYAGWSQLPIFMIGLGRSGITTTNEAANRPMNIVRRAQESVVNEPNRIFLSAWAFGVPMLDEPAGAPDPNQQVHYGAASTQEILRRAARTAMLALGLAGGYRGSGPKVAATGTQSGAVVTFAIDKLGATSIPNDDNLTGYEFSTNGGTSYQSANDVDMVSEQLVLSGMPAGVTNVRSYYAKGYDETNVAVATYPDGTVPVAPMNSASTVSQGGTPTPSPTPPSNADAPNISANGSIVGAVLTVTDPGDWTGDGTIERAFFRNGAQMAGTSGTTLTTTQAGAYRRGERGIAPDGATSGGWVYSNEIVISVAPPIGRGEITASAARTARFSETQEASARAPGVPYGAIVLEAPMDPHTTRDFAFDFSGVIGPGGEIEELTKVVVNAAGYLDGFRVSASPAPFLNLEGSGGQVRGEIIAGKQNDPVFNGAGTQADLTIGGRLKDGQTIEATFIVPLRNL